MLSPIASRAAARAATRPKWIRRAVDQMRAAGRAKSALALADQAVVSLANFATNAVVARTCGADDFGVYFLALSLLYFVRGIQEQLVAAPYTIYCHRRHGNELASYAGSSLLHQATISVVTLGFIGCLALSLCWTMGTSHRLVAALFALLLVAPFFLLREYVRKLMFAHFRFGTAIILDCVVCILQLTGVVILYWRGWLTAVSAYLAIATACAVATLAWFLLRNFAFRLSLSSARKDWAENWKFGRWALATHLIGCSTPYFMPWLVASLRGEATVGLLAACQTLVGMANMFVTGVSNFLSPRTAKAFADGGSRALRDVLVKATLVFLVTLGGFCLAIGLIGGWLGVAIFGNEYVGLGGTMLTLALALLASSLGMTAGNGLWAMDRPFLNMRADVVSLAVTFGCAVMLVTPLGEFGAALSCLVGNACAAGVRWFILINLMRGLNR